jgi:hypothetical protein
MKKLLKIFGGILIALLILTLLGYTASWPKKNVSWGVNFSTLRAKDLDMKPEQLFKTILDDLQPKLIRLPVYWEEIEANPGEFDFALYDRLLSETDQRDIKVIAAIGHKLPRWPECHHPQWWTSLEKKQQDAAVLNMVKNSIEHLKTHPSVGAWQIENEPFFPYGPDCPTISRGLYKQELAVVRALDDRPIIGTDSGEKGAWLPTAWSGVDILGATMYREVYHDKKGRYLTYPLPAWTYNIKAGWTRIFSGANQALGVELQAEPWFAGKGAQQTPYEEQLQHMNSEIFLNNVHYARQAGFAENYFWGVEWWYWLKATYGDNSMIEAVKTVFHK